jgi:hypothetical protein
MPGSPQGRRHLLHPATATRRAMNKDVHLGDLVELPSGLVVKVTLPSDPARPWRAVQVADGWRVRRERLEGGTSTFYGGRTVPPKVSQADAEAVAEVLNRVRNP